MNIVLDSSAAVEIVLNKADSKIFSEKIAKADLVIAPELFISEISNVAWKYHKLAGYSSENSFDLAVDGIMLVDEFIAAMSIWKEALSEAIANGHPVYDCLYLVCARRNNALLLSKDNKLKKLCRDLNIQVL